MQKLNKLGANRKILAGLQNNQELTIWIYLMSPSGKLPRIHFTDCNYNAFIHPFCKDAEVPKSTSQKADEHYIKYIKTSGVCCPQYT